MHTTCTHTRAVTSPRALLLTCALLLLTPLTAVGVALTPHSAAADSPLTSAELSIAYSTNPLVNQASKAKGTLTDSLAAALSDPQTPSDVRAAIINALGWSFDGQRNAPRYAEFIAKSHQKPLDSLSLQDLTPQEAFSLGYLLAMDDYHKLSPLPVSGPLGKLTPQALLDAAAAAAPQDFSVALIRALVLAQAAMDHDWCKVFQVVDEVIKRPWPARNMRDEAVTIILGYIGLYAPECLHPRPIQGP